MSQVPDVLDHMLWCSRKEMARIIRHYRGVSRPAAALMWERVKAAREKVARDISSGDQGRKK